MARHYADSFNSGCREESENPGFSSILRSIGEAQLFAPFLSVWPLRLPLDVTQALDLPK
jgi:hypothetical protein